jgi:hypothetical protein
MTPYLGTTFAPVDFGHLGFIFQIIGAIAAFSFVTLIVFGAF